MICVFPVVVGVYDGNGSFSARGCFWIFLLAFIVRNHSLRRSSMLLFFVLVVKIIFLLRFPFRFAFKGFASNSPTLQAAVRNITGGSEAECVCAL